jgi:hypothetical protein
MKTALIKALTGRTTQREHTINAEQKDDDA